MVPSHVNLLNVFLVKENFTADGIVETFNKSDDRRLAAAWGADKGHGLAVLYVDIDTIEYFHIRFSRVVEFNVLDIDSALFNATERLRHLFLIVVAYLFLFFCYETSDFVECALDFGDNLQVVIHHEYIEDHLPVV